VTGPATPTVVQALAKVMADVGTIGKDKRNTQQGFNFRGIDDVMNALHGPLARHGVLVVPEVLERLAETRKTAKGGDMNVVHLHVRFTFHGPAGDQITGSAWGEAQDSADKSTGKAHSMALKTFLLEAFQIPTEDLDDADATGEAATPDRPQPGAAARQAATGPQGGALDGRGIPTEAGIDALRGRDDARALVGAASPAYQQAFKDVCGGDEGLGRTWKSEDGDLWARLLVEARTLVLSDVTPAQRGHQLEEVPF
jgi:hypothetical protein